MTTVTSLIGRSSAFATASDSRPPGRRCGRTARLRADGKFLHIRIGRVQQSTAFGKRHDRDRVGQAVRNEVCSFDRIDRDIHGKTAAAEFLTDEEHRRFVALAFTDHDAPIDLHLIEPIAHRLNGGAVGNIAFAAAIQREAAKAAASVTFTKSSVSTGEPMVFGCIPALLPSAEPPHAGSAYRRAKTIARESRVCGKRCAFPEAPTCRGRWMAGCRYGCVRGPHRRLFTWYAYLTHGPHRPLLLEASLLLSLILGRAGNRAVGCLRALLRPSDRHFVRRRAALDVPSWSALILLWLIVVSPAGLSTQGRAIAFAFALFGMASCSSPHASTRPCAMCS